MILKEATPMHTRLLLTFLLSVCLAQTSVAWELNGIGSYKQLRKEFYIGALYLSEPSTDPKAIQSSYTNKRMALRVTTQRWSPRRWSLQWQNDIAINNSFDNDPELINNLMLFSGFLDDKLVEGDEIIIDYIATVGTIISINDVKIIETKTAKLFNNLLNVWIGKLPPSGEFKAQILGTDKTEQTQLLNRYNQISYNDARTNIVASWVQAREDKALARTQEEEAAKQKEIAAKKEQALKLAQLEAQKQQKKTYVPPKKVTKKKVITKKKKIASISTNKTKSKSKSDIAAENKYYLQLYQWELTREIRNAVEYTQWAKQFGQKGAVTLSFNVNRNAEVSNISGDNPDMSELLVSALRQAILSVVPFILPPDALPGNRWRMSVTYHFDPRSDEQPFIKKPSMPNSLKSKGKISRAEYKAILSQYIDDVIDIIEQKIEYPVWAEKLNQRGEVSFKVFINKDGSVEKITEETQSRHSILNQEVRDAIEASLPLPPIPEELKLNRTQVLIKHQFK